MKRLVVLTGGKVPHFENATVLTFEEEFEKYKKSCKKDYLRTEACFSWNFDSFMRDLKNSVFVYPGNADAENWIKKYYKVIEEYEANY